MPDTVPQRSTAVPNRSTGYHNAKLEEREPYRPKEPPTYTTSLSRPRNHSPHSAPTFEPLPPYNCSVQNQGLACIKYESHTPFGPVENVQWAEVFVVLAGTGLSIHQPASHNIFSKAVASHRSGTVAGRLIKLYTLQCGEVGIASDLKKYELIPRSPMTALLPEAMREALKKNEPNLFEHVRQYIIRLRLESDQFLLRLRTWDERANWIDKLCASIDISPTLDDRTEPRYHTLPRRRRHRQPRTQQQQSVQAEFSSLMHQQERIIRERFPQLLTSDDATANRYQEHNRETEQYLEHDHETTGDPEADDLDTCAVVALEATHGASQSDMTDVVASNALSESHRAIIMGGIEGRRPIVQQIQSTTRTERNSIDANSAATPQLEKLPPTTQMHATQEARYRRRCMPSLLQSAARASDVLIKDGAYWKLDIEAKTLRPYSEPAPGYSTTLQDTESLGDTTLAPELRETISRTPLRATKSSTTVNDSADSSVNTLDDSSSRAGRLWKDVGQWGRTIKRAGRGTAREDSKLIACPEYSHESSDPHHTAALSLGVQPLN